MENAYMTRSWTQSHQPPQNVAPTECVKPTRKLPVRNSLTTIKLKHSSFNQDDGPQEPKRRRATSGKPSGRKSHKNDGTVSKHAGGKEHLITPRTVKSQPKKPTRKNASKSRSSKRAINRSMIPKAVQTSVSSSSKGFVEYSEFRRSSRSTNNPVNPTRSSTRIGQQHAYLVAETVSFLDYFLEKSWEDTYGSGKVNKTNMRTSLNTLQENFNLHFKICE